MSLEGATEKLKEAFKKAYDDDRDRLDVEKLARILQMDATKPITVEYLTNEILPRAQQETEVGWRNAAQKLQNEKEYATIESVVMGFA